MEKQMKNKEIMVEPIETVIGAVGSLEEKIEIREMDENSEVVDAKPVVAVVSTINESPPDFKSMVKVPTTTVKTGKTTMKRRRKCKKGYRRNKKTKRCRKSVKKM